MNIKLNTDVCPIVTPDTYGTGFQYEVSEEMWDEFKSLMCKYAKQYITDTIKESKLFANCPITIHEELKSPRFYNYGTDWIDFNIDISDDILEKTKKEITDQNSEFYTFIKRYDSRPGFISNYPTTFKECQEAFKDQSSNHFLLLIAEMIMYSLRGVDLESVQDDYLNDVIDYASDNGYFEDEE